MKSRQVGVVAWSLFVCALALVPVGLVLAIAGHGQLDLPPGRESELLVEVVAEVAAVLFAVVGLLVARKQPANPIGWIFLVSAVGLAVMGAAYGYADLALYGGKDWVGGDWAAWLTSWLFIAPVFVAPCLVAQLFPDGRPLSPRWRRVLWLSLAFGTYVTLAPALDTGHLGSYPTVANPAAVPRAVGRLIVDLTWGVSILMLFAPSLVSIVLRFRRSRGVERQQLKWLVFVGGVVIVAFLVSFVLESVLPVGARVAGGVGLVALALIPVAVAVAILRYRLYDVDRVISKTLVYGSLTAVLGAAYAGLVLAGQALFSSFAGGSNLAIAVSTLVVAALFLPLRGRLQRLVDRRFYRRRYDAQRTLEAFGARLRQEIDLELLSAELCVAVDGTVQPAHVSLWLRSGR
jgi:hypothetical protein